LASLVAALPLVVCLTVLAPPAWSQPPRDAEEDLSSQQVQELAARAAKDPTALERLRRVRRVDGQPVDLGVALDGPAHRTAERLGVLAERGGGEDTVPPSWDPSRATRQADDILDGRRFRPKEAPRPFRGVLRRLGGWLQPVAEPIGRLLQRMSRSDAFLALIALAVVAVAVLLSTRAARRRARAGVLSGRRRQRPAKLDPDGLEREADQAERRGELDRAFRLRFLAGLVRLDDAGHLTFRPSLTTREVVRKVPSPTLASLAGKLEDIVYGGRLARKDDVEAARSGWPQVLIEAPRRLEKTGAK
jgi:hypothetical protein